MNGPTRVLRKEPDGSQCRGLLLLVLNRVKRLLESLELKEIQEIIDRSRVARLGVINLSGEPEVMPIVFARVGESLVSPIDGKPKSSPRLRRLDAIRKNSRVGLVIDFFSEDWDALCWIKMSAGARIAVGDDPDFPLFESALRNKYPQYKSIPLFLGEPTAIVFSVYDTKWWASGGVVGLKRWLDSMRGV